MKAALQQLTQSVFYLPSDSATDRPVLGAIQGKNQTLLVDAGNSSAHAKLFLSELKKQDLYAITSVVLTHWHWDHIFGTKEMNLFTLSSEQTKQAIEKMINYEWTDEALEERVKEGIEIQFCADMIKAEFGDNRRIEIQLPNMTINKLVRIDLGNIHCTIEHVGGDHASDSTIVYVEEENVLFLGDCLYPNLYSKTPQYTVKHTRALLQALGKYKANHYVLSHELPLSPVQYNEYIQLLAILCELTETHQGNKQNITEALSIRLNKELNEDERETIDCFVNGYID
ncbi:MBL fold metallo-hydrolase [Metabacillus iocasae]|uniref:Glyoxylase-like metal-dependent hydrolase (Beta-lactamase superfamily II) n=1 Tax=Priestia iocasae TaxID=2291674 RepID=A0ABS2QXG7_9BACI|nr:MBL fold metallo-hydrolase [Metabacillus iocasae]MBM7703878.1 glyoxylase-like metal-dependent hydrolase (beta-lactamase superfamily II) [Metabacillus iocasae]